MIFSSKIYKIVDGKNPTLYQQDKNTLNLYIFNKSLRKYHILVNNKRNCVFSTMYNYQNIIQIDNKNYYICSGNFITKSDESNL